MAELRWGAATHEGMVRDQNEDSLLAIDGAFIVADGMGGHEAGEVASSIAIDRLTALFEASEDPPSATAVVDGVADANSAIFRAAIANPAQRGMGTTLTALAVIADPQGGRGAPNLAFEGTGPATPDETPARGVTPVVPRDVDEALVLANVGDSRTYLMRHGRLRRITVDHSYVQDLVTQGYIDEAEARTHPRRNIITRALGIEPDVQVDWWTLPLIRGDRFLLCSDGLVDEIDDSDIADTLLHHHDDPQAAAEHLVQLANEAGGRDNTTVVIVDVLAGEDPPDPTEELDVVAAFASDDEPTPTGTVTVDQEAGVRELASAAVGASGTVTAGVAPLTGDHARAVADGTATDTPGDWPAPVGATPVADAEVATAEAGDESGETTRPKRSGVLRYVALFMVIGLLTIAGVVFAAWARSGYFVAFDDDDVSTVYKGQSILWFEPTVVRPGPERDELSDDAATTIDAEPSFDSEADAVEFLRGLELVRRDATNGDEPSDADGATGSATNDSTTSDSATNDSTANDSTSDSSPPQEP